MREPAPTTLGIEPTAEPAGGTHSSSAVDGERAAQQAPFPNGMQVDEVGAEVSVYVDAAPKVKVEPAVAPPPVKAEKRLSIDEPLKSVKMEADDSKSDKNAPHRRHSSSGSSHRSSKRDGDRKERSSSHHCSRCYKRSKMKRASIGVQCRRDRTVDKYLKSPAAAAAASSSSHVPLTVPPHYFAHPPASDFRFAQYMYIETHSNGGATVVHMYQDEINHLSQQDMEALADEFFKVSMLLHPKFG